MFPPRDGTPTATGGGEVGRSTLSDGLEERGDASDSREAELDIPRRRRVSSGVVVGGFEPVDVTL